MKLRDPAPILKKGEGESACIYSNLLIDWLTLRIPLDSRLNPALHQRIMDSMGRIFCYDSDGVLLWEKRQLDIEKLRSDTPGLVWQLQGDGKEWYLVIAASPASLEHQGVNVFGSMDIRSCANTIIRTARKALRAILPPLEQWQCRRIDITGNYVMPDAESVKQALRQLMVSDCARRKAGSKGSGDSVYWGITSDISKGKAYHKGPQMRRLQKLGRIDLPDDQLRLLDRVLRLEHIKGSRWFRRLDEAGRDWYRLTAFELWKEYREFFGKLVTGIEVNEMNRSELIERMMQVNGISEGRARSAFNTLRVIRADGFEVVKGYLPHSTFYRHLKYLRAIGITDADMTTAKILPIRPVRIVLAQPVGSWAELRRAA